MLHAQPEDPDCHAQTLHHLSNGAKTSSSGPHLSLSFFPLLFLHIAHDAQALLITYFFHSFLGHLRLCNPSLALRSTRGYLRRSTEVFYTRNYDTTG